MQVKDVDTLYSDYLKVRDIIRGRALHLEGWENVSNKVGKEEEGEQTRRAVGEQKERHARDGKAERRRWQKKL